MLGLVFLTLVGLLASTTGAQVQVLNSWSDGFQGKFVVDVTEATEGTWKIRLQFSKAVTNF